MAKLITRISAAADLLRHYLAGRPRDRSVRNNLLALALALRESLGSANETPITAIEEALIVGNYPLVARLLAAPNLAPMPLAAQLVQALPPRRAADCPELARYLAEIKAVEAPDPLHVQACLSRLVAGLDNDTVPLWLKNKQRWLWKRASALARQRANERAGAATRPVQNTQDCWLRCLYHVAALEPVRMALTYDAFVDRVGREFPERDIPHQGLSFANFESLMEKMGVTAHSLITNEDELAAAVEDIGGVIGGIGFFEKDTSHLTSIQALPYWRQHAVLITAVSGKRGQRLFTVDDPALPYETRYTQAEFDVLQLTIYRIEPVPATSVALRTFLGAAQ